MTPHIEGANGLTHPRETLNLACSRCGYLLRGLAATGQCPECGQTMAETLAAREKRRRRIMARSSRFRGAPLSVSDRRWIRAVAVGCYALAVVQIGFVGWHLYCRRIGWTAYSPDYLLLVLAVAHALALWLLAWPERLASGEAEPKRRRPRGWLRALSLGAPAAAGLALVSELVEYRQHAAFAAAARAVAVVVPVAAFYQYDYLVYLAVRARRRRAALLFQVTRSAAAAWLALSGALAFRAGAVLTGMASAAASALLSYGGLGLVWYLVTCFYLVYIGRRFLQRLKSIRDAAD